MIRFIGAFIISLMISNWLYAEFLIFIPGAEPYVNRAVQVMAIPTHDEWPAIANSPGATELNEGVKSYIGESILNSIFSSIGIGDSAVEAVLEGQGRSPTRVADSGSRPYATGVSMFLESTPDVESFGGYQKFLF